ncbi:MAG: DUF4339 domain-containing protein [Anaerolineae bacterium]|nr:DUF4339 domain-containing protein [Anaerolineae bacterium]
MKTQHLLEKKLAEIETRVREEGLDEEEAFGAAGDWILPLGSREAFLNPKLKQWMWHDRLHGELVFAGCGVRQGILVSIGKVAGVKALPYEDEVGNWCIVLFGNEPSGPMTLTELKQDLASGKISKTCLIWSPHFTTWLTATDERIRSLLASSDPRESG